MVAGVLLVTIQVINQQYNVRRLSASKYLAWSVDKIAEMYQRISITRTILLVRRLFESIELVYN